MPKRRDASNPTALFIGAGSSAAFGCPVTSELFPDIRERLTTRTLFSLASNPKRERAKMLRLQGYLEKLLPAVFAKDVELPWITEILSLLDQFIETRQIASPMFMMDEMRDFRTLLEEAILEVIVGNRPNSRDIPALDRLTDWILCAPLTQGAPMTIISTNYDILVESLLFEKIILQAWLAAKDPGREYSQLDFGFAWREHAAGRYLPAIHRPPDDPWVRLLKLHGSLNWLRCPLCGFTYVNTTGTVHREAFREDKIDSNNTCLCGHGPVGAVIVAPSVVRRIEDPNLLTIWNSAQESLRRASEWIFAGYSLPSEDIAIRAILVRAYHARGKGGKPPKVRVVQREPDAAMAGRYRLLFPQCSFEYGGFERFIADLPDPPRHYPAQS
ncbi:MAG: SIR2 family protein [Burkholderiaceae bacterium]|nr:SIR2 family protein [Burkholderiaceae bacterium]